MKFKVTAKTKENISVEFEDGSHAVVPIVRGQSKEDLITMASTYHEANVESQAFNKASDVPIEVSDEWLEYVEPVQDYRQARAWHYPSFGKQCTAFPPFLRILL